MHIIQQDCGFIQNEPVIHMLALIFAPLVRTAARRKGTRGALAAMMSTVQMPPWQRWWVTPGPLQIAPAVITSAGRVYPPYIVARRVVVVVWLCCGCPREAEKSIRKAILAGGRWQLSVLAVGDSA